MEHKLILGGEQFLPFARSRIKALRATGLSYASQQFEVDGVSIKVRVEGEHEYIRLEGGTTKILSGAVKGGTLIDLPIPPEAPSGTAAKKTMRALKPTSNAWNNVLKNDPAKPTTSFNDETFLANAGDQYTRLTPTLYSGKMAKAASIIMGMGKTVVYGYRWNKCHGITTASDGKHWLIEISTTEGILAMPFPKTKGNAASTVDAIKFATTEFGGIPANTPFPTGVDLTNAITAEKVYRLKTVGDMAVVFGKIPYSPTMGWSFSDDGSEAHNTCYSTDGTTFTGHHYKIDLSIVTVSGVTTASAAVSLVSEGPLTAKQLTPGGVYTLPPCTFFDVDAGVQYAVPAQNIDFATTEAASTTPLIACHINGVLDVVGFATVPEQTYSYFATGPDEGMGAFTVTEITTPAGKHMRYGSFNPITDGFSISKYAPSTPVASASSGGLRYVAYETFKESRTRLEAGRVAWGRSARDAYTVFRPKATVINEVNHTAFSFDDALFAAGATAYDCISIYPTTISGGLEYVPFPSGGLTFPYIAPVTTTKYPIVFVIRNGTIPVVENDATLWAIAAPKVVFNAFGTSGQLACTETGYSRFVGAFLDISDPSPAVNYTFIGYT